ncbi:MAG: 2-amino-4-hydroxy-6-hydroxymethyldihydropteridine diphosphokinase [Candidatus Omnitrophica bacterium]|nr:2-amino-4-hydroxy-6-hydroxymethyldihydropteridine diphosphokinase [Candidatus Omnitrophota bacterium]
MVVAFIGIGSNLGNRAKNINSALDNLGSVSGVRVVAMSSVSETQPQKACGPNYFNAVAKIETDLEPQVLLGVLLKIEQLLGRQRPFKNAPRTIDLDILLYGNRIVDSPELIIPHPRMLERDFVLNPLLEIEPKFREKFKDVCKR